MKITPRKENSTVVVKTRPDSKNGKPGAWWNTGSKSELGQMLLATASFLKEQNMYRYRQASMYARLYGNLPLQGGVGTNLMRMVPRNNLPTDRPTMSVITSEIDTIVSRLTQSKPRPLFLTEGGDYKQRKLAKEMNTFIAGELYQTHAYDLGALALRDACIWGDGFIKVLEDQYQRVSLERRIATQLLVDSNETFLGQPRQIIELSLWDRSVAMEMFHKSAGMLEKAENAYVNEEDAQKTVSDQVILAEAWHLPSGPDAKDGLHAIVCTEGPVFEESYEKKGFPFAKIPYSPAVVGYWGQGLAERQLGNQLAINRLLMTVHKSINLVGVPRVFVEDGSKIVKAHLNNEVGSIVTYRGTPPQYQVAPCMPAEVYQEINNVIQRSYQEEGISQMAAGSQKPAGLNSGEAIRNYDDIQSDRLASLSKRYEQFYVDLAYLIIDKAKDICERDGHYETVYPDKNGTQKIDLPAAKELDDPFVIQCFDVSSLPRDPAGRLQKVTEMMQAGIVSPQEGRRLLGYADIEQDDKLANAAEERILKVLDEIVEEGKYTPPDPFTDLTLGIQKVTQYYNLYVAMKLDEDRAQMLRDYFTQLQALMTQAATPPPGMAGGAPQATPLPPPTSDLIPTMPA